MDVIKLSPLYHDVKVGCLYCYYNAAIHPGPLQILGENVNMKFYNPLRKSKTIATDITEKIGLSCLGVKQHLSQQIHVKNADIRGAWFYNLLKDDAFSGCNNNNEAQITAYLKFVRRTETLSEDFVSFNIAKYCTNPHSCTHLIDKVEYGAEIVLRMHKPVDPSKETKQSAEQAMRLALKTFFGGIFGNNTSCPPILSDVLNTTTCSFQSSIRNGYLSNGKFVDCFQLIHDAINIEDNDRQNIWRPTEMRLRRIPTTTEVQIGIDLYEDIVFDLKKMYQWIVQQCHQLIESPSLNCMPPLKETLVEFQNLLKLISFTLKQLVDLLRDRYVSPELYSSFTKPFVKLLRDALNWLEQYHEDMEKVDFLLKENSLPVLDLRNTKAPIEGDKGFKRTKVFVLHSYCVANALEERFQKWVTDPTRSPPVFVVEQSDGNHWENIYKEWQGFVNEANNSSGKDVDYVVGILPPSSPYGEGAVFTTGYEKKRSPLRLANFWPPKSIDNSRTSSSAKTLAASEIGQRRLPAVSTCNIPKSRLAPKWVEVETSASDSPHLTSDEDSYTFEDCAVDDSNEFQNSEAMEVVMEDEMNVEIESEAESTETECVSDGARISEEFARRDGKHSQLLKDGQPSIFLLEAQLHSISDDLRWCEIGKRKKRSKNCPAVDHKVIILMGATGCGKSTLINGMVNYILGVSWADPFRFKIVREEESAIRNQAYSQTSSVTAYTIHHKPGMAVPYSITIIDTPGYGDTRGVERDKEITSTIHRFLTEQQDRVTEIHAACFVAASGDSRLTATQRYIIDSVLSIFGKDMKDNIRLLVTFADNADPPVVQACLAANFPSTPAGIFYSKFNSSVLYADNSLPAGEDDLCFDELFWDMGQENFEKFFSMLSTMEGRSLVSTRQVIESRNAVKLSIEQIESELEVVFVQIEKIEWFRRQLMQHDNKIENCKKQMVETFTTQAIRKDCSDGMMAYNCQPCQRTCEKPIIISKNLAKKDSGRQCNHYICGCKGSVHAYQNFFWVHKRVKSTTTVEDIKAEMEANCKQKMSCQELLVKCNEDVDLFRAKVLSLLDQVATNVRILESTALRSNVLSAGDYLSMIKSRVSERQDPGYLVRMDTLTQLQHMLEFGQAKLNPVRIPSSGYQNPEFKPNGGPARGRGRGAATMSNRRGNLSTPGYNGWK